MASFSLTGKDTITIKQGNESRTLVDLADGNTAILTFPNKKVEPKIGKNGNSLFNFNYTGKMVEVEIRVVLGSSDDKYLNNLNKLMDSDPASFVLLEGTFVKRTGDGNGNIINVTYSMNAGVITQDNDSGENTEGDTSYNVVTYRLTFTNNSRNLG